MKTTLLLSLAFAFLLSPAAFARARARAHASASASANAGYCGEVVFDCDRHVASAGGLTSPLDCGVSTPKNHSGRIENTSGRAAGTRWRCMRGKPKVDIGLGAVIVHTPCGNRGPKGQNQHFRGSGCLNVNQEMLNMLKTCQGAPYHIKYAAKGGGVDTRYASRRTPMSQKQYAQLGSGSAVN